MKEFSIYDISDVKQLEEFAKNGVLPFLVQFYVDDISIWEDGPGDIEDPNILKGIIPDDILDNHLEDSYFTVPVSYGSKLDFIKFIENLGFCYDSCNF